jgi:hypothetical protein
LVQILEFSLSGFGELEIDLLNYLSVCAKNNTRPYGPSDNLAWELMVLGMQPTNVIQRNISGLGYTFEMH